jgi:iron complex outermembrane recepter protein
MRRLGMCLWTTATALVALPAIAAADEQNLDEVTDIKDLSLADLLDTEVQVASKTHETARETPGIVTVITRDDIISSGARDLLDVLVLVPGFAPGVDVEGIVDLGVRGQWGHEGKILLLIDGQPMNELLYSTLQLGNHYPIEAIQRIEVIRGPGSAVYGGFAELAVINIITRDAADLNGVAVSAHYGQLGHGVGHATVDVTFGDTSSLADGLAVSGALSLGRGMRSRAAYEDFSGTSYSLDGNSALDPAFADIGVKYKGLELRGIFDDYRVQTRDGIGPVVPTTVNQGFRSFVADAQYHVALGKHFTLTPRFQFTRQTPWEITDTSSELFYTKTVTRYTGGVALSYDATKDVNILTGAETFLDHAHLNDPTLTGFQTMFGTSPDVDYQTFAGYAQMVAKHAIANLTIGARYEHHSAVGGSLVPRVALTKVMGRFHAKVLASQAFRAPGIENINLSNGSLVPEKTTVFEGELGCQLDEHVAVTVNAFDITIKKPIVYDVDQSTASEMYQNFDRTGSRGVEADVRVKLPGLRADMNYSYYTSAGKNTVSAYEVPGRDDVLLAFPAHKLVVAGSAKIYEGLSFNPSAVIYGERFGYTTGDTDGNPMLGREPATAIVNANLNYRDLLVPGLELGAGVYDITDARMRYLQPYNGGHPPLPGPGRDLVFRVNYERKL